MNRMRTLKFGGSSLANAQRFAQVAEIILDNSSRSATATVVSAPQNITNKLVALIKHLKDHNTDAEIETITTHLKSIIDDSSAIYTGLDKTAITDAFNQLMDRLKRLTQGAELLGHCPAQTYAQIVSIGERFSVLLLGAILKAEGKSVQIFDPEAFICVKTATSEPVADVAKSKALFREVYPDVSDLCLMPGFVAQNEEGETTTLGRNGSDYSAAILAACVDAELCEVWTDVDGVYNSDPNLISDATLVDSMTYNEAMALSYFGAKILHPKTIAPLKDFEIPCVIKNTHAPENPGTLISKESQSDQKIKAVTNLSDVALITISGTELKGMIGIASRVFNTISQANISIIMISQSSAEYCISFCVPGSEAELARKCLNIAFELEIKSGLLDPIQVTTNLAVITVVGDGMKHHRGIAAKFFTALAKARVNIIAIAQDSSERSISAVVRAQRLDDATRICHQSLFQKRATIDAIVIGCGTVGAVLLKQIQSQVKRLSEHQISLNLVGIANSKSLLLDKNGITTEDWKKALLASDTSFSLENIIQFSHAANLLNPVIIDCTSSQQIADQYTEFLDHGFHVVTANKKANTGSMDYYQALRQSALVHQKKFLYETNVGAGLPVIDNLQGLLRAGDELQQFEGILSGSLSYIFGEVHKGLSLSEATIKARDMGFTEPNPAEDLGGLDVARKALVIAREAGMNLELSDLEVIPAVPSDMAAITDADEFITALKSYDAEFDAKVKSAEAEAKVLRYIAQIKGEKITVGIQAVDANHPMYAVKGGENAMAMHSRYYQPIPLVTRGYGAGADVTAAGLFGDLLKTMSLETSV